MPVVAKIVISQESGHSYLPNDRDFSVIENKCKGELIFGGDEWFDHVRSAMVKQPFNVFDMSQKSIDINPLLNSRVFNNSNTTGGDNFNFLKLKSFKVTKKSPIMDNRTAEGKCCSFTYPL